MQEDGQLCKGTSPYVPRSEGGKYVLQVRNPATREIHTFNDVYDYDTRQIQKILLDMYRQYTASNLVGYFIVANKMDAIVGALPSEVRLTLRDREARNACVSKIRKDGHATYQNEAGYSEKHVILSTSLEIKDGHMESIDQGASKKNIAKAFGRDGGKKKSSRVLASKVISLIS
jgi:hypothetical protein